MLSDIMHLQLFEWLSLYSQKHEHHMHADDDVSPGISLESFKQRPDTAKGWESSAPAQRRGARGHAAAQQLPPCSRRGFEQGDLLALLPGSPIVADICVTHPLAASAVKAAARDTSATAKEEDSLKRDEYSRTGTGACRIVPLSHETFGRAGPSAFALLNEIAEFAAGSGVVSNRVFLENAMRNLSTTRCRGITRQVLATVLLRARLNSRPVVAGLPVPTDDLVPVVNGPT